ncbi:MAG: flavin reductase family protein [Anaerovoracaceae bacterium]
MRINFGANSWLYPEPVLIVAAYGEDGVADAMNAAWGGISSSNQISMCLSPGHKTVKNILAKRAFTVSIADAAHVVECDYVGIVSGNNVPDKLERAGFHTSKSGFVDAPIIEELPMALECELVSYDEVSHRMVGKIVNINADEKVVGRDGKIDPAKLQPIIYDAPNSAYRIIGEKVGNAFSDGEKLK